jgi:hypothetical protein
MSADTVQRSPLSRPLLQPNSREAGGDGDYDDDAVHTAHQEERVVEEEIARQLLDENSRLLLESLFGRPCVTRWNFWWQHLPSAAVLGASVGVVVPLFLWTSLKVRGFLFSLDDADASGWSVGSRDDDAVADSDDDPKCWWWLMWTIGGSLLASILLQFPMAPKPETLRTVLHHVAYLDGSVVESLYTVVSSWISLTCGAPIGMVEAICYRILRFLFIFTFSQVF